MAGTKNRIYRIYFSSDSNDFEELYCSKSDIKSKLSFFCDLKKNCICYVFNKRKRCWSFFLAYHRGLICSFSNIVDVFN